MPYLIQEMRLHLLNFETGTLITVALYCGILEFSMCSNFTENDGGSGGAVSMTYFPSRFDGINVFQRNRGRSVVVRNNIISLCDNGHERYVYRLLVLLLRCMGTCTLLTMVMWVWTVVPYTQHH